MGATLIHGWRFAKQLIRYPDGTEREELFAEGEDLEFPSYSSVSRMVAFCEARG
jgi:hypothetical protein